MGTKTFIPQFATLLTWYSVYASATCMIFGSKNDEWVVPEACRSIVGAIQMSQLWSCYRTSKRSGPLRRRAVLVSSKSCTRYVVFGIKAKLPCSGRFSESEYLSVCLKECSLIAVGWLACPSI